MSRAPGTLFTGFVVPADCMPYATVGNWQTIRPDGRTVVDVLQFSDRRYEILVAVHELAEAEWCRHHGISDADVTEWDRTYEARRPDGDTSEPGDDPCCPYRNGHVMATKIERMLADELGVDWDAYTKEVEAK